MTICGVIFAAGEGTRLRPLTETVPKPLCPIGNVALLDRALARLKQHRLSGPALVAVNACYLADRIADHVGGRAYVSREPGPQALGTSGALGHLREAVRRKLPNPDQIAQDPGFAAIKDDPEFAKITAHAAHP